MRRWIALLGAVAVLLAMAASAEAALSAAVEGNTLVVRWSACSGGCTLTVYQNNWPICVRSVNGAACEAKIPITGTSGRYSVRLKTSGGCLTAEAGKAPVELQPVPTPTPKPTSKPTEKPTPVATPAPTVKPTEVAIQPSGEQRADLASEVVAQVNAERAKQGLDALRVDSELTRAACVRAREIAVSFSHTRPDGTAWSTVSASAYGENIARGQRTADKVMAAWMTSEGHRANILRASYGSIGVCAFVSNGVVHWVQLFGK